MDDTQPTGNGAPEPPEIPPPALEHLDPTSGPGATAITLTGTDFGQQSPSCAVWARVPGGEQVLAPVTAWTDTSIAATLPPFEAFGSGGPLDVWVVNDGGSSGPLPFVLYEAAPPAIGAMAPVRGIAGTPVTITGSGFGRPVDGSAVLFADANTQSVAAIDAWSPETIVLRVPAVSTLDGPGLKTVRVHTPWGETGTVDFELGELPTILSVEPGRGGPPGGQVTLNGTAFGAPETGTVEIVGVFEGDTPQDTEYVRLPMTVVDWTDTLIRATVPSFEQLRTTGAKQVVVTSRWGPGAPGEFLVSDRGSITAWTRVEPHARADSLDAGLEIGLRAELYDPLWLVGRQWQLRELDGEDAGSPILARITGETAAIGRWRAHGTGPMDVPGPGVPLEALIEHEQVLPVHDRATPFTDRRLAAESGLHWLRILSASLDEHDHLDEYRAGYLRRVPMPPPTPEQRATLDAATLRYLDVMAGRVPDGATLYVQLQQALPEHGGHVPHEPPIHDDDRPVFRQAVAAWFAWWEDMFTEPTTGGRTWNPARMQYDVAVSAETAPGEVVLAAPEYDGRRLDWPSFQIVPGDSLRATPGTPSAPGYRVFEREAVPSPITFPGMPAPRWFELEDAAVDFGAVHAGPTDLIRLLFVEFATVYGNDWFTVPVDALPTGALCRLSGVTVTDTFGRETPVTPLADTVPGFRMFDLGDRPDLLLVADALPSTFESAPLEEVLLLRDEPANLVWGVERVVSGAAGRPVNRVEVWQARLRAQEGAAGDSPVPAGAPPLAYRLATTVPDYWVPFVLTADRDPAGGVTARWLTRAALADPGTGAAIPPQGELLEHDSPSLRLYDEVVARDGVRLRRQWQYGRGPDGSTHLWRTRRRDTGRGEGSSGLRFDVLDRRA